jgi:hypothetical protein
MPPPAATAFPGDKALVHLFIGVILTFILMIGSPFVFGRIGWSHAPEGHSWWILIAAFVGVVAKLIASETATGEVEFYKLGYDLCTTTLGGIITALAIQLSSSTDMFPGFASASFLPTLGDQEPSNRTNQLVGFFILCLGAVYATARIARSIHDKKIDPRGRWALLNAAVGAACLAGYALLLAAKG